MATVTYLVANTAPVGLGFESTRVLEIHDASHWSGKTLGALEGLFDMRPGNSGAGRVLTISTEGGQYSLIVRTVLNMASADEEHLLSLPEQVWPPDVVPLARRICVADDRPPFLVLDPEALRIRLLRSSETGNSGERP